MKNSIPKSSSPFYFFLKIGIAAAILAVIGGTSYYFYYKSRPTKANVKEQLTTQIAIVESIAAQLGQKIKGLSATINAIEGFSNPWRWHPPPALAALHAKYAAERASAAAKIAKPQRLPTPAESIKSSLHNQVVADVNKLQVDLNKVSVMSNLLEPFQGEKEDVKLINIQPITVKQTGYVGPISSGIFDENTFVKNALKSGCRTFILQIDYYEGTAKDPALFPAPNEPCLLYRDDTGGLVSLNSGSILKVTTALAALAFYGSTPSNTDPLIVILYCTRTPDPVVSPKDYLAYCSKIAKQLNPLTPFHLGITPIGDFHRQAREADILTTPFSTFEKQVIIMSNLDTTLFRNVSKLKLPAYPPYDDLDFWTHIYLAKDDIDIGNKKTAARITTLDKFISLSPNEQNNWAMKNKGCFTVMIPKLMSNPTYEITQTMIQKMGVNVVPLDLFSFPVEDTKHLLSLWKNKTWNTKPHALHT
jgi:hypothetical protein